MRATARLYTNTSATRNMKHIGVQKLTLALALCAAQPPSGAAAKAPDKLALDPGSPTALVIMKTVWWQPAASMRSAFKLALSAYDPVEQKLLGGPYSGGAVFEAQKQNFAEGYLVIPIKPGRWVFQSYSQQDKWSLCFNAASSQFDVKSGEVVYLGEFDALKHRQELADQALSSGRRAIRSSSFADFFDLPEGPRFRPIDEAQLDAVREMLSRRGRQITAPVHAAEYSPAKFGTGSTLFAERRCGGYFATGAKEKGKNNHE